MYQPQLATCKIRFREHHLATSSFCSGLRSYLGACLPNLGREPSFCLRHQHLHVWRPSSRRVSTLLLITPTCDVPFFYIICSLLFAACSSISLHQPHDDVSVLESPSCRTQSRSIASSSRSESAISSMPGRPTSDLAMPSSMASRPLSS